MVDCRADNIEHFANGLVNKLVDRAMDNVDNSIKDARARQRDSHKTENPSLPMEQRNTFASQGDQNPSSDPSEFSRTTDQSNILSTHDDNISFDVDQRDNEEIRRIVHGLQTIQIGDSSAVKPVTRITSLEIQVKRAVQEMSNVSQGLENNEITSVIEGQGDVNDRPFQIVDPAASVEANNQLENFPLEISESLEKVDIDNDRQIQRQVQQLQQAVSKLHSTCFLHRIIKELEDAEANNHENVLKVSSSISGMSQERIAVWEENEEKFIRLIDVTKKEETVEMEIDDNFTIAPVQEAPDDSYDDVEIREINAKPASSISIPTTEAFPVAPIINSDDKSDGVTKDDSLQPQQQQQPDLSLPKSKIKKIRIGEKFRRFFRSAFKRGKDC